MQTGKVYRNLAVVQQKIYSYLTRFKNVAFHAKHFFTHYDEGAPTTLFASGSPPSKIHPWSSLQLYYYSYITTVVLIIYLRTFVYLTHQCLWFF